MSIITGYSLWLVPEKGSDADEFLRKLIYQLSLVYKTSLFNPHVTLLPKNGRFDTFAEVLYWY